MKPRHLIVLGVLLFVIFGLLAACNAVMNAGTANRIKDLTTKVQTDKGALDEADKTVTSNAPKFARHWSDGLSDGIKAAKTNLDKAETFLGDAQNSLNGDDRDGANKILDQVQTLVDDAEKLIVRINGPPTGLYQELQRKDQQADSYVGQVQGEIVAARSYIQNDLALRPWSQQQHISFARSLARLNDAQNQLDLARYTLTRALTDDNVKVDRPMAYDQAATAEAMAIEARSWADSDGATPTPTPPPTNTPEPYHAPPVIIIDTGGSDGGSSSGGGYNPPPSYGGGGDYGGGGGYNPPPSYGGGDGGFGGGGFGDGFGGSDGGGGFGGGDGFGGSDGGGGGDGF